MRRQLIVIGALQQATANAACAAAGLGPATFAVGLSATGLGPATAYWCCTAFGDETRTALNGAAVVFRAHDDSRGVGLVRGSRAGREPDEVLATETLTTLTR